MVKDKDLKPGKYYWAKAISSKPSNEIEMICVKYTGLFFRDINSKSGNYLLFELNIHRELDYKEIEQIERELKFKEAKKEGTAKEIEPQKREKTLSLFEGNK